MTVVQQLPHLSTCKPSPWPAIISACQHQSDGPIEEDEGSQEEGGSNKDKGNNDNDSKQEHTKDNTPAASATSVNSGMFVFFHDVFSYFLFHFSFRFSWYEIYFIQYGFLLKLFFYVLSVCNNIFLVQLFFKILYLLFEVLMVCNSFFLYCLLFF